MASVFIQTIQQENAIIRRFPGELFPKYFILRVNEFDKVAKTTVGGMDVVL